MENPEKVKIDICRYRVREGESIHLKKYPTACDISIDKEMVKTVLMPEALEELKVNQAKLYAQSSYGLIIVLQAMDARQGRDDQACIFPSRSERREGGVFQAAVDGRTGS